VTTTDGTGIVHIAPAFGEDDANVGRENNLPTLLTVDEEGKIISRDLIFQEKAFQSRKKMAQENLKQMN
jgi:isoleucyl-tRNA synthetase